MIDAPPRIKRISWDYESFLIGPQAIVPKPVCSTFAERVGEEVVSYLIANGDHGWVKSIEGVFDWLEESREYHQAVLHNGHAFDLPLTAVHFPHLITRIFDALEFGQFRDTITREKLLNLALSGVVDHYFTPDGQRKDISYRLASLVAKYLGIDRLKAKGQDAEGNQIDEGIWRLHFDTLDGVPSDKYPPGASSYAMEDARDTLLVAEGQESRARDEFVKQGAKFLDGRPFDVFQTEPLHVGAMFCLTLGTYEGFGVDASVVDHMEIEVGKALRPEQTYLLFESGLYSRPEPVRPYAKGVKHTTVCSSCKKNTLVDKRDQCKACGGSGRETPPCSCAADTHEPGTPKMVPAEAAHRSNKVLLELVVKTWAANRLCDEEACPLYQRECEKHGLPPLRHTEESKMFPKTEANPLGGQISCDGEVIADLAPHAFGIGCKPEENVLAQYNHYTIVGKLQTLEIPRLREALAFGGTIHPGFDEFKKTGRVSSRRSKLFPSVNIQQIPRRVEVDELGPDFKPIYDEKKDPKTGEVKKVKRIIKIEPRNAYIPRNKGWVILSIDYSFIELCTHAQQMKNVIGYSKLMDAINKGFDPHAFLGAQLAHGLDSDFVDLCHALGASGPDDVYRTFLKLKGGSDDEKKFYKSWRNFAKPTGLGYPGGLGPRTLVAVAKKVYGVTIKSIEQAKQFKEVWLTAFPENREYLNHYVRDSLRDEVHSNSERERFAYFSPLGAYRARCSFTEAANGFSLQGPSADGMKIGVFNLQRACWDPSLRSCLYGCRLLAAIHDEAIITVPNDCYLHERAFEASRIWIEGMRQITPDVLIKAEPAAMVRWEKDAEPVYGLQDKRLRVWDPRTKYVTDPDGRLWI
jgi:hypothetical protein